MTDFSKTLIRASMVYDIMTDGNGKTPYQKWLDCLEGIQSANSRYDSLKNKECKTALESLERVRLLNEALPELELHKDDVVLSDGCKTFLAKLYMAEKYGKWATFKDRGNKYTTKGKMAEEEAITMLSRLDKIMYVKNDTRINNDYCSGIPDILIAENYETIRRVIDVKCPYDAETFIVNLGKDLNPKYWWQIQTYMWLVDAPEGEVSFCLMNIPEYLLNYEKRRLFDRMEAVTEEDSAYKEAEIQLAKNLTFDDMPLSHRRIKFVVDRDDEAIAKIPKKVEKCREYLQEIEDLHLSAIEVHELVDIV